MKKERILLLMIHWIGDTFWAAQVIPDLKKRFPDADFYAAIKKWSEALLNNLIDKDKIIILKNVISDRMREKFSLPEYLNELRKTRTVGFDMVIDLSLNRYSAIFAYLSGAKNRIGLNQHALSFLYTRRGNKFPSECHLSQRPWEVIRTIIPDINIPAELFPPTSNAVIDNSEIDVNSKLALLIPGAGWKEKEWGIDNFAQVGKALIDLGYSIVIAGSEKERALCDNLKARLNNRAAVFIKSLGEFIALLSHITIAISNDSGPAHLAAASGIKLITVFRVNNHKQYFPIGKNVTVVTMEKAAPKNIIKHIIETERTRE